MATDQPLVTQAYVCPAKGEKFVLQDITLPPMKPTMVELDMTYCGLCHTDIHMRDNDWGISNFPLVAGHEGIGKVRAVGDGCKFLKVGDVVGITWCRDSCANCDKCFQGRENLCRTGYQGTFLSSNAGIWGKEAYNEHGGCFSKVMRIQERFAIKLPDNLPPEVACPLLCGGGTVFEPIVDNVTPGCKVAVASVGGLGTSAIRFARQYGAHVTALSRSDSKKERALGAGAHEFYACLGDEAKMAELAGKFDLIIDTNPVNKPIAPYMGMLAIDGTYNRVGIPSGSDMTFSYDYIPLIFTQKKVVGTIVTGTTRMKLMFDLVAQDLDLFAKDKDDWKTEIVPYEQINEIMDTLKESKNTNTYRYMFKW